MRAVRPLVVALTALVGGFACDRSPTGPVDLPTPSSQPFGSASSQTAPTGPLACGPLPGESATPVIGPAGGASGIGPRCFGPTVKVPTPAYDRHSNYAVAW